MQSRFRNWIDKTEVTHNKDLRYRTAGHAAVSKPVENPNQYSYIKQLLSDHTATRWQAGACELSYS